VRAGEVSVDVEVSEAARDAGFERPIVLADFGSTYTKLTVVDAATGTLIAKASHLTTIDTDVLDGFDAALDAVTRELPQLSFEEVLACSSAAGGLRLGVIGLEKDLTAEAGRRAALSAGARVVTVVEGGLVNGNLARLLTEKPDILLLTGGTDGGNRSCLIQSATAIASSDLQIPVVVAGNAEAQHEVEQILRAGGRRHVVTVPNVMPEIGTIREEPVREVVRELFILHVIGGKHLSARSEFLSMVLMPTPEAVLLATALLATLEHHLRFGDVAVVDIGGATTDVHSAVSDRRGDEGGYAREILPSSKVSRTVEGDLGLRWNAPGIVEAAMSDARLAAFVPERLEAAAERLRSDPGLVPADELESDDDSALASLATKIALRRHAGEIRVTLTSDGASLRRTGKDLRTVRTLLGTGGIFAHATRERTRRILETAAKSDDGRTRLLPRRPNVVIDRRYVMAAAGLLSVRHPSAAATLLRDQLVAVEPAGEGVSEVGP
jgi:uncharacterized protein (TIGR01319 family)